MRYTQHRPLPPVLRSSLRAHRPSRLPLSLPDPVSRTISLACLSPAEYLKTNPSLEELNINENNMGDPGAIALANALKENTKLKVRASRACALPEEEAGRHVRCVPAASPGPPCAGDDERHALSFSF